MSINVSQISKSLQRFSWPDYLVFMLMLISCMCIGVYFGWQDHLKKKHHRGRRGSEALDYLVGGRKMKVFPVAMSLVASFISGISLLGTSTEIYVYGTQYCYIFIAVVLTGFALHYIYLPVFHELQLTSTYEYLDRRFDRRIRLFGSVTYIITSIIWIPIVIYVPSLAFAQVTGINIHLTSPVICAVCIFYTCIGGLKAVVWTDVIQGVIMLASMIVVAIKATVQVGGLNVVIERNYESGRIEAPIWDLDMTIRHSFWSTVVGGFVYWNSVNGCNQSMVQRYLSLPNLKAARKAVWFFVIGIIVILSFCVYNGLLIYAMYHDCDPLQTGLAKQKDQLVPLLVMSVLGDYPGLTGCFVAGVFSAALSSLSTGMNSLAAVVLEDFVKPACKEKLSDRTTAYIMRSTVIFFGLLGTALVFVVEHLGQVLQLSMSLSGAALGASLAVYIIGLFMPWINATSTLVGACSGIVSAMYIVLRAQTDIANKVLTFETKPTSIEGCTYSFVAKNVTNLGLDVNNFTENHSKPIHHMSYMYYTLFGALISISVAQLATFVFGKQDPDELDRKLITPIVRKYLRKPSINKYDVQLGKQITDENVCKTYEFQDAEKNGH
ncbi:sodium-coupled monocarboxylate transporter 1-like [Culicoides brevitarsis]|uniref:sodium-coupled monocarboxylate transporter 1-like n=1 Tax=Culicoides brevitarsis TaxID=469753 RepID=UPI00307CAD4F